jgi:phenylalanyl-tRNA synthetase beta chain
MKISYSWIREFVDVSDTPQRLGTRLTDLGMAVDALDVNGDDAIFELDIATNRPDCLSHFGVAREVSVAYSSPLNPPRFELRQGENHTAGVFSISIADTDLCGRYCGRYITGVRIGPSPEWLKARLEALGLRSINNVADITNYVMLELGQPLHAFDADTLEGKQIIVRRAELDEKITTLDGVERSLNPSMLVIADAHHPVALAGVMGGGATEISASTTNVFLESANFDPLSIRKTSRVLGLTSEASYRFERGADIEMASYACDRAAALIQSVAGGTIYRDLLDVYPAPSNPVTVKLRRHRIAAFLGAPVADPVVTGILERLGFQIEPTPDGWTLDVPSYRADVVREEDLLEEIARHYGFDKFPATLPKWAGYGSPLGSDSAERLLRSRLAATGYSEIVPMAFSDNVTERKFRPAVEPVVLLNPMAEDESILRTSLVPGMLRTIQWNLNRGIRDMQLYELGKIYSQSGERRSLILGATGNLRVKSVHETENEFDFFDIKGDVQEILESFNLYLRSNADHQNPPYYHPGRSVQQGDFAVLGELHPDYAAEYKLRSRVYLAEIDVEKLLALKTQRQIEGIPKYPSIRRDLSLLLSKTIRYSNVEEAIRTVGIPELVRVEPFDRMETGPFDESRYALAISLMFVSPERTLTDDEVDTFSKAILNSLRQRLGAELRQ